jgi:hypothetical protein
VNTVADCNAGDFGVSILMSSDIAVLVDGVDGVDGVQSLDSCVDGCGVTCGVGALKLNVSLKMLNDDI